MNLEANDPSRQRVSCPNSAAINYSPHAQPINQPLWNGQSARLAELTFKNRASYIQDGRTATLQMLHFIYCFSTNINTEYFNP